MIKASKESLKKEIGFRLKKVREKLDLSHQEMAYYFGTARTNYTKKETGENFPNLSALNVLGSHFDVSLDWLICNKGPMFYKAKDKEAQVDGIGMEVVKEDVKELVEYMERIPLLRYEMLTHFQRFKAENKDLVEDVLKEETSESAGQ